MKPLLPSLTIASLLALPVSLAAGTHGAAEPAPERAAAEQAVSAGPESPAPSDAPTGPTPTSESAGAASAAMPEAGGPGTESTTEPTLADDATAPEQSHEPPTVAWDAQSMTLSAEAQAVPFAQVREALAAAGIDVKPHESWEGARISASFEALPLAKAGKRLFGNGFVLTWSHRAPDALPRPRLLLMSRPDAPEEPVADADQPAPDADTLRSLAERDDEAFGSAAEAALRSRDHLLRQQTLELLATRERLAISRALMFDLARTDPSSAVRRQALGLVVNHGFGVRALEALENAGSTSDPVLTTDVAGGDEALETINEAAQSSDPALSEAGQEAQRLMALRARMFDSLSTEQRDWLFKPDEVGNPFSGNGQ